MTQLSHLASAIRPSTIGEVFELATQLRAEGQDLIDLSVGEPAFDTPPHICEAARTAIAEGQTRYTAVDGTQALKEAVCRKFARDNGMNVAPVNAIVGSGAKQVLSVALQAVLDPGDEVILPTPCWTSHLGMLEAIGARARFLPCLKERNFHLLPDALDAEITPQTRLLMLTSPGNPTGAVLQAPELEEIAEVLRRHTHVLVLSDDLYEKIVFSPSRFATLASVAPDLSDRIFTVNGVSKAYAMTGWRIGFGVGPVWWADGIRKLMSQTSGGPCSVSQAAAIAALDGPQEFLEQWANIYERNRDVVLQILADQDRLTPFSPEGAFYVNVDVSRVLGCRTTAGDVVATASDFCRYLLSHGVVAVPGEAFQAPGLIRISTAADEATVRKGVQRMVRATGELG